MTKISHNIHEIDITSNMGQNISGNELSNIDSWDPANNNSGLQHEVGKWNSDLTVGKHIQNFKNTRGYLAHSTDICGNYFT